MAVQYDIKASEYEKTLDNPFRMYPERNSFVQTLGDIRGKSILDVGCGEGYYTRILKKLGAGEVIGLDMATKIIDIARAKEQIEPLGIKYIVEDLLKIEKIGDFDIISTVLVLHYAETREKLYSMCDKLYKNLKTGGKLIVLSVNPDFKGITDYSDYYFTVERRQSIKEGDTINFKLTFKSTSFEFKYYHYTKDSYEKALTAAGFKNIKWIPISIGKEGIQKFGADFWKPYLQDPLTVMLTADK